MSFNSHPTAPEDADPLDSLLDLENQFYNEGYNLGVADGAHAARVEGRSFGVEKGFEKFVEMGRLGGRASVWKARLSSPSSASSSSPPSTSASSLAGRDKADIDVSASLGALSGSKTGVKGLGESERLRRQVHRLDELTKPTMLSTRNDEEDVDAFDERLREARTKAMLFSKIIGEDLSPSGLTSAANHAGTTNSNGRALRIRRSAGETAAREMEDFVSLPGARKS